MLGARILGKEGAEAEALKAINGVGGGAIVAGPRIMGEPRHAPPAPPVAERPAKPSTPAGNRVPPERKAKSAAKSEAEPVASFTELEVEQVLAADPHAWPRIVEAESARPDGPRPAVAKMVLDIADLATDPPVPTVILEALRKVVPVVGEPA